MNLNVQVRMLCAWLSVWLSSASFGQQICTGSQMVLSCGNLKCDRWLGENAELCPSDCSHYSAASYNYQEICHSAKDLATPRDQGELIAEVQGALKAGRKVKVVGRLHSTNSLICNEDLLISTSKLETIFGLETYNGQTVVRAEAGVTMGQLAEWLHQRQLSLGYSLMGFRGISIAGAIGTGAHGSSPKHPSVFAQRLESVKMLEADGKIVTYDRLSTEPKVWKALSTHLGMLGVLLELRVRVEPQFALDERVDFIAESALWEAPGSWKLIENCDFGQMMWFPGAQKVLRMCGMATSTAQVEKGARIALVDYQVPDLVFPLAKQLVHSGSCNSGAMCFFEDIRVGELQLNPPLRKWKDGREVPTARAVGFSHDMSSGILSAQGANFFQNDWALVLPVRKLDQALLAMQDAFSAANLCLPFGGIFIRYGQASTVSWMAHSVAGDDFIEGEPVAFLDMVIYNPMGLTESERQSYEKPHSAIIKMLIDRFGARLHWGKNKDWALAYELQRGLRQENIAAFLEVVQSKDPFASFSNVTSQMLRSPADFLGE